MNPYDRHDRGILLATQAAELRERFGVPTFTSTLKINRAMIRVNVSEALAIGEFVWRQRGRPDSPKGLLECLEDVLTTCNALGILWPARFLERKKQIERVVRSYP